MKETLVLSDPAVFPTDDVVFSQLRGEKNKWSAINDYMAEKYTGSAGEWRYYNDGKQWLYKMQYKKKTVFWIGIVEGAFRITFYFGGKAEQAIVKSNLPDDAKDQYLNGERYGNIRAITFRSTDIKDISVIHNAIDLKISLK